MLAFPPHIAIMPDAKTSTKKSKPAAAKTAMAKCPICGKPPDAVLRPFCSKRCADVDLHRWLSGRYVVPVTEDEEEDELRQENEQENDGSNTPQ
jgi:endogenous inhibitor of DNA gyrase (YacG/DUF329 family)